MAYTNRPNRYRARVRWPHLVIYRVSPELAGWGFRRNRYSNVTIGVAALLRHWCVSLVWARLEQP